MPKVFRAMKRDDDGLPTVGASASALGVRIGADIDLDQQGNAIVNDKGMSVSPSWRVISIFRIPKRLGGQGSNNTYCFTHGDGPFQQSAFAAGLELLPDHATHDVIRPTQLVSLTQYEADLAATRADWQVEEI